MKRGFDLLLVILGSPLWLPVMALVAVFSLIAQGSPVFYRSQRSGRNGEPFGFLKFRTMREGEGSDLERLTSFGRFLRRTSLDELPQLWHVITGRMSLVGPRPLPVRYLPRYSPFQRRRLEVPPGITGWAQVNGRNTLDWPKKFELDVWYVDHHSLALDIKIIALTFWRVVNASGIDHSQYDTMVEFKGGESK